MAQRIKKVTKIKSQGEQVPQTKLVEIIGFSVVSVNKWRRIYDDFPGPDPHTKLYDVQSVQAWLDAHPDVGEAGQKINGNREKLMCENLEKRNRLLDNQLAIADFKAVDTDHVLSIFGRERSHAIEFFRKRMLSELPAEMEGKTAREIAAALESAFNEFLQDMQDATPRIIRADL